MEKEWKWGLVLVLLVLAKELARVKEPVRVKVRVKEPVQVKGKALVLVEQLELVRELRVQATALMAQDVVQHLAWQGVATALVPSLVPGLTADLRPQVLVSLELGSPLGSLEWVSLTLVWEIQQEDHRRAARPAARLDQGAVAARDLERQVPLALA